VAVAQDSASCLYLPYCLDLTRTAFFQVLEKVSALSLKSMVTLGVFLSGWHNKGATVSQWGARCFSS